MSQQSFADLGVSQPVVAALAAPRHHRPFAIQAPRHRRRPRRPRRARQVPHGLRQDARLRRADRRRASSPTTRARGARARPDARARHARSSTSCAASPHARAPDASPPSTAASASRSRPATPARAHIVVATPGRLEDLLAAPRLHARATSRSSSSTRPTACSTWASARPSTASSPSARRPPDAVLLGDARRRGRRDRPRLHAATRAATSTRRRAGAQGRRSSTASSRSSATTASTRSSSELRADERDLALVFVRTKRGADRLVKRLEHRGRPRRRDARQQVPAPARAGAGRVRGRARSTRWSPPTSPPAASTSTASRTSSTSTRPRTARPTSHRIGRTGRAGADGVGITFVGAEQARDVGKIAARAASSTASRDGRHPRRRRPERLAQRRLASVRQRQRQRRPRATPVAVATAAAARRPTRRSAPPRRRADRGMSGAPPRNLVNLKDVDKGYGSRTVLRDVTLGVAAGDRIGVVGRNGDGKSTLLRLDRRASRSPTPARSPAPAACTSALLGQGDDLDARAHRSATSSSAAAPTTSGRPTPRSARCSTACSAASRCARFPRGPGHADRAAVGRRAAAHRARPAAARRAPSCCCSTSRPTTSTSRASTGSPATSPRAAASLLVVTHDRWFLDAVCTPTWEVADGAVHQYEGGYAAYVLARAERDRQAAAREDRRRQLLRKELAWLRRGPPARTSKPKFRIEAANALIADEPEAARPRRAAALRHRAARRQGARRRATSRVAFGDRDAAARRDLAARARATASRWSASTARARRRWSSCWPASSSPTPATVERGATVRARPPLPGHGRDPGPPARARVARGGARARDARRRAARSPPACSCDRFGFRGEQRAHARARPLRRRAPAAAAHAAADGRAERAAARRADQRPRHRHAHRARGPARRLAGHARGRQPRPLLRRARVRRRLRADRRRRHPPPARAASSSTSRCARGAERPRRRAPARAAPRAAPPAGRGRCARRRKEVARLERALERLAEREAALHEEMADARDRPRAPARAAAPSSRRSRPSATTLEAAWLETVRGARGLTRPARSSAWIR